MDNFSKLLQASNELEKQKIEEGRSQNSSTSLKTNGGKTENKTTDTTKEVKQKGEGEKYINVSITTTAHKKLKTLSTLTGKNIRDLMSEIIDERFKLTFDAELKKFSNEYL